MRIRRPVPHGKPLLAVLTSASVVLAVIAAVASQIPGASAAPAPVLNTQIKSVKSSLVLDVADASNANGAAVIQYPSHGRANQRWDLLPVAGTTNHFTIVNKNSGKCLDVPNNTSTQETALQQWDCHNSSNQQWRRVAVGNGYSFIGRSSGQALDIPYPSLQSGLAVEQYPFHGGANQQFTFAGATQSSTTTTSTTTKPTTTTRPTTTSTTKPAPSPSSAMPTTSPAGWKQVFAEDFNKTASTSNFASTYANSWCGYADGTGGKYFNSSVISAHDGVMDFSLNGTLGAAGSFGPPSTCYGKTYGRYAIRFKAVDASENGTAMMLWPTSNVWGDGEIDFAEGSFQNTIHIFHHGMNCTNCSSSDAHDTKAAWTAWHTMTVEWKPDSVKYYLDGALVKTVAHDVPDTRHRMTIQMAPLSSNSESGHFLVDWVAMWDRA